MLNVLKMGKVQDPAQDIMKTSSLPTLMINLLKNTLGCDLFSQAQEVVADLIQVISELSKIYFTRTSGIDPLFSKQIVHTLTEIIKRNDE